MQKRKKTSKILLEEYLHSLNNRESYISITIGFLFILLISIFSYNYFSKKIQTIKISKQETGQVAGDQESANSQETYTIVKGDDLWKIAVKSYGDGFEWIKIAKANNLSSPNNIHVGNILTIPK